MSAVMPEKVLVTDLKNGVKVRAEWPHLVSFGGGRLSTAVTILPLKEGLTTVGSSSDCDIIATGTGVQRDHCRIYNDNGIVILSPTNDTCSVTIDGVPIEGSSTLSQGCMVCIGRSNYFRFNHPEQAAQLRNILPANSRVSVVPLQFTGELRSGPVSQSTSATLGYHSSSAASDADFGLSKACSTTGDGDADESFSSKLRRFEELTSSDGKRRGDSYPHSSTAAGNGGSSSTGNNLGDLRALACRPSDLTTSQPDSKKPAYLSYIGEKLFGQCISGSAPYPIGSSGTAALDDFYRERSGSASSSGSSSSGSSSSSSSSSNSSGGGSFLESGSRGAATCIGGRSSGSSSSAAHLQSDGGKRATAAAAPTAAASAAAASSASDDLCLQQGQLPLLRHRLGRGGGSACGSGGTGRTPSCDIKTLSMMSTETSVWGSTSSLATVETPANENDDIDVDDDEEGGATPSALTPVGRRTFGHLGTSDTVFGNGFADDGDDVDASDVICRDSFRQVTAQVTVPVRGGLSHEQSTTRRVTPLRLPSAAVPADAAETTAGPKEGTSPSDSLLLQQQQHKHSRSVELRQLAEEAERRERRRLDEVLLMCAEYDQRAAAAAATAAAAAAAGSGVDELLHLRQPQLQFADLPALMPLRLGPGTATASTSAVAAARVVSLEATMAVKTSNSGNTREAGSTSAEHFQPPHQHDQRHNFVQAMVAETVAPTATGKLPDGNGIAPTNVKLAPPSSARAGVVGAFGAGRSSDLVNGVRLGANGVAAPPKSAGSSTFPEFTSAVRLAAPSKSDYVASSLPALQDEEHVYDTPPVEPNRFAAVPAPGVKTLLPEGTADQLPVAAAAAAATATHQQETERIYDDPATYVSFVEPCPPVPVRLTAATQTMKAKVPEKAPGVLHTLYATVPESNKSTQDQQQQQRARPAVPASSQQQPEPLSTANASSSNVGQTGASTVLADASAQLQSLSRSRHQIVELLAALLNRIAEVTKQQETIVRQFELVRTRMEEEQTEEMNKLQSQSVESARLRARQLDALARVTREQEEEAAKVERARSRMEALEQRRKLLLAERDKRTSRAAAATTDDFSNSPPATPAVDYYTSELEQLDGELKDFEDLEFQQLEVEAKFEEEKEEVQCELAKQQSLMMKSISAAEEKLNARIHRQRELLQKARADADAAEHRRQALVAEFRTQKDRLLATDKRMRELDAALQQATHAGYSSRDCYATAALEDDLTWQSPAESNHQMLMLRLKADDGAFGSWRLRLDDVRRAATVAAGVSSDTEPPARRRSPATVEATTPAAAAAAWPAEHEQPQQQQRSSSGTNGCVDSEESSIKSAEALSDMDKTSFSGSDDISDRRLELHQLLMQARAHVENADSGSLPSQTEMTFTSESETSSSYLGQLDMSSLDSASAYGDDVRHRERNITPQDRPLTRYLPARAIALDLRAHIEAAGHNVSSCPHVIIDDRTCRGYLLKMGYKMKSWNKRWFVFSRDKKALLYYMDKHDTKPRGVIPFHAIEDVFVDHLKTVKTPHHKPLFCVKTTERPYHVIAKTPETMSIWIDVIFSGAEGYREF